MKTLLIALTLTLNGCALYRLTVELPDGKVIKGTALVANDSDRVALRIKNGDLDASFTKTGTAGGSQIEAIEAVADAVDGPL